MAMGVSGLSGRLERIARKHAHTIALSWPKIIGT
jgi:hypothetical protein